MRVNRMLEITTILLGRDSVTARELAQRFEVSTRTIYRDIEALSAAGVPVYMSKGAGGGISLMDGYSIDRALITDDEAKSLMQALQALQATQLPGSQYLMEKVTSMFRRQTPESWVEIDFSGWSNMEKEREKFDLIKAGIQCRQAVEIAYIGGDNRRTWRKIWPVRLHYKSRAWYLLAHCTMRQAGRMFRVSRIVDIRATDESFTLEAAEAGLEVPCTQEKPIAHLTLRFSPNVLYRVYDEFDADAVTFLPDGSVQVQVFYPEDEWVYGFLLSFGPDVEVVEPVEIRRILLERLERAAAQYREKIESTPM